mgnify:FL=1
MMDKLWEDENHDTKAKIRYLAAAKGWNEMISEGIALFLDYIRDVQKCYRTAVEDEQEANDETQDILHSLELETHDYHSMARLSRKLKEVRQKRRKAKDLLAQAAPIVEWAENHTQELKSLERLLGIVRKEEKHAEGRFYTPKTDIADR